MNQLRTYLFIALFTALAAGTLSAQTIDDAVRIAGPPNTVSARAAALGNAFTGVADDFSAIYFNPAGLALIRRAEFSAGLMNYNGQTETTFLGNTLTDDEGAFSLNNLGIALPFPVDRGSLVIGVGYMKLMDFSNYRAYQGYNTQSSIIPSLYTQNPDDDLAWLVGLEEYEEDPEFFRFPVQDNVQQENATLLSGSLNQWSFGGSAEVAKDIMLGLTLNVLTGEFISDRRFTETDPNRVHQGDIMGGEGISTDFQSLTYQQRIEQQISGVNLKFGGLYNYNDIARFGLAIQTPTSMSIDEDFAHSASAVYANVTDRQDIDYEIFSYDFSTPWVFSFGASYAPLDFLRVSGDVELRDYSEIEYDERDDFGTFASDINRVVREQLRNTVGYRFGLEFQVPRTGLILRGGYGLSPSAFDESGLTDVPAGLNQDRTTISGGIGYIFQERFILNATYLMATRDAYRFIYNDPDIASGSTNYNPPPSSFIRTEETVTETAMMFSMAYLF